MSTLLMIRHSQASFGSTNYDKLSETGIAQSFLLGEYWVEHGQRFDAVFSGAQERQWHTIDIVCKVYRASGMNFPEPQVLEEFSEYDASGIMTHFVPMLLEKNTRLREIVQRTPGFGDNSPEGRKAFLEAFEIAMDHWLRGDGDDKGIESWTHFKNRVVLGVKRIIAEYPSGKRIAVFTSGGPISVALQYALEVSDKVALNSGWVIKNSSMTEFKYRGERFSLTGFNMTPHVHNEAMVTYR